MTTADREELEKERERFQLEGNKEEDKRRSVPTADILPILIPNKVFKAGR